MAFVIDVCGFVSDTRICERLLLLLRGKRHQSDASPENDMEPQLILRQTATVRPISIVSGRSVISRGACPSDAL